MRTEQEMFDLILNTAQHDERIRAVYMTGSRANPNREKDLFQDYDIVYVVTDTTPFIQHETWIQCFGETLICQQPDKLQHSVGRQVDVSQSYRYLMLFTDGNRLDLQLETKERMYVRYGFDKLTLPLLDKDHCLPEISLPSDNGYRVQKPIKAEFVLCCNEFWWHMQDVAKGLWRDELPYAKQKFEMKIRPQLEQMIAWWIGTKHNYEITLGEMNKYTKQYLPSSYWAMYQDTYSNGNNDHVWNSVFIASDLFRILAHDVATYFEFFYNYQEDKNMTMFLKHVRKMVLDPHVTSLNMFRYNL